jgi:hypothetical protein
VQDLECTVLQVRTFRGGADKEDRKDGKKNRIGREAEKDKEGWKRRWCIKKGKAKYEKGRRQQRTGQRRKSRCRRDRRLPSAALYLKGIA